MQLTCHGCEFCLNLERTCQTRRTRRLHKQWGRRLPSIVLCFEHWIRQSGSSARGRLWMSLNANKSDFLKKRSDAQQIFSLLGATPVFMIKQSNSMRLVRLCSSFWLRSPSPIAGNIDFAFAGLSWYCSHESYLRQAFKVLVFGSRSAF